MLKCYKIVLESKSESPQTGEATEIGLLFHRLVAWYCGYSRKLKDFFGTVSDTWQSGACLLHWELLSFLQERPGLYLQGNAPLESPATRDASSLTNPRYSDWDKPTSQAYRFPDARRCNWIFPLQRTHASWIRQLQTDWLVRGDWLESESITGMLLQDRESYSIMCKVRMILKKKTPLAH